MYNYDFIAFHILALVDKENRKWEEFVVSLDEIEFYTLCKGKSIWIVE